MWKEKGRWSQGPLAAGMWPSAGMAWNLLCFSSPARGRLGKKSSVKLNELNFIGSSGWQARRELGQTTQSFPGDVYEWEERELCFLPPSLRGTFYGVMGRCFDFGHWQLLIQKWNSSSPPVKNFVCVERQCSTCEPHFKMHFEVWANNVNDIQWDCQMLVIYSHFHINVGPPVMNWKLNKHISFN